MIQVFMVSDGATYRSFVSRGGAIVQYRYINMVQPFVKNPCGFIYMRICHAYDISTALFHSLVRNSAHRVVLFGHDAVNNAARGHIRLHKACSTVLFQTFNIHVRPSEFAFVFKFRLNNGARLQWRGHFGIESHFEFGTRYRAFMPVAMSNGSVYYFIGCFSHSSSFGDLIRNPKLKQG